MNFLREPDHSPDQGLTRPIGVISTEDLDFFAIFDFWAIYLNPSFFFYFCLLAASYLSIFEAFLDGGNAMVVRNDHAQPPNYDNKRCFALLQIWLTCWLTSIFTVDIGGLCGVEAKN